MRLIGELPVGPAIEVLHDANVGGFFLVVAHADLESLVHPVLVRFDVVVGALAFADDVESIARIDADHFVFRCVIDRVFSDELQAAVGVSAVEAQASLGQRDAEMIRFRVLQFLHHPNLGIRGRAISGLVANLLGRVIAVLLGLRAIVDIEPL